MKFREFKLRDDINQREYIDFRVGVEERKPAQWAELEELPIELFYDVMVRSAVAAGWVQDVVETNEYDEEVTFSWSEDYLKSIPAGQAPLREWGDIVFKRWLEYRTIDPN